MIEAAEKRKAGRPTKLTPETTEKIVQALTAGNTRQAACGYAGISDQSFLNYLRSSLEFLEAVKKAEADAEVRHVANIAKASNDGNWTASAWWLERRRYQEWGRKDRHEHTGAEGGPIEFSNVGTARNEIESRLAGLAAVEDAEGVPGQPEPGDG